MGTPIYAGIRVLEWGVGTACAYAGQLLADRGAEVIKVEPPEGDPLRWREPHRPGESKRFQWLGRGKRSLVMDAATREGKEVLQRLAAHVDVVLTTWPEAQLAAAGMTPAVLCERHPKLVFVHGHKFGGHGEWASRPANDVVLQAFSGMLASEAKRRPDGGPDEVVSTEITQFPAGLMISMGIAAALYHRECTGRGQLVETSELGAALLIQGGRVGDNPPADAMGIAAERARIADARAAGADYVELAGPVDVPVDPVAAAGRVFYRSYATRDGAVFLGALSRPLRDKVRRALGLEFLARDDPDFDPDDPDFVARCRAFEQEAVQLMASKTTAEWLDILERNGVPCGEVAFPEDLGESEQARRNGYVIEVEHPQDGVQLQVAPPAKFGCDPEPVIRPSPALGQHTEEILRELG